MRNNYMQYIKRTIKINIVLIMLLLASFVIVNSYAKCSCNVDLAISETKVNRKDNFTIDINVSDIESEMGIMAFGATIDYDRNSLYIEKIEGLNNWETPVIGSSYNDENGKIAITKNGFGKENETIIRVTFSVKEESKKDLAVTVRDISISDGTELVKIEEISKEITVKNAKNGKGSKTLIIAVVIIVLIVGVLLIKNKK